MPMDERRRVVRRVEHDVAVNVGQLLPVPFGKDRSEWRDGGADAGLAARQQRPGTEASASVRGRAAR